MVRPLDRGGAFAASHNAGLLACKFIVLKCLRRGLRIRIRASLSRSCPGVGGALLPLTWCRSVCITEEVQLNGDYDDETSEEEYEPWTETERHVVENTTIHDEIRAWEEKHPKCGMMHLDGGCTEVRLHGVVVRTAADFAAMEQADREFKMEEEQRKFVQAVLLELKQKMADRAKQSRETVKAIK